MRVFFDEGVKRWTDGVAVDAKTLDQARDIAKLPFIYKYIALMPDCHVGKGSTVGSVIPTVGAVIPSAVGVDIGCGMISTRFDFKTDKLGAVELAEMRRLIEAAIPTGRTDNGQRNDIGAWGGPGRPEVPEEVKDLHWGGPLATSYNELIDLDPDLEHPRVLGHLGTLGTGNHFIELEYNESNDLYITIHSGSRGPGARIGGIFMKRARKLMEKFHLDKYLPNLDLSYFPEGTKEFDDYWRALQWAQKYAWESRCIMLSAAAHAIEPVTGFLEPLEEVHCHHNYARRENHGGRNVIVTRKGAISAREGEMGIIPGSMGAKTFIVKGKGNRDSFTSASHGAGRKMSRTEARRTFTLEDHALATEGVECLKGNEVLDETPGAYKDIDQVMKAQEDLVEIVQTLRPLVVVKGAGE
jgi:tRNA-splicing ligase RtcB